MEYDDVVQQRRSIRGYLNKPVPKALIREVLALALRAPTSYNTQPWHFHVVSGQALDRIRQGNVERNLAGVPDSREFRTGPPYDDAHRQRQIGVAKQLFAAMGIARDDMAGRQDWVLRGFRQFDAPVSIIVTYDRSIRSLFATCSCCPQGSPKLQSRRAPQAMLVAWARGATTSAALRCLARRVAPKRWHLRCCKCSPGNRPDCALRLASAAFAGQRTV